MLQPSTARNDLSLLLQAAEFVEKQSKIGRFEQEHGYAAQSCRYGLEPLKPKMKVLRRSHNRTSHNELEKNRRAHLRTCLDNLKAVVPLRGDIARHTTLGLLKQARSLILTLQDEQHTLNQAKAQECHRNAILKKALLQLQATRKRANSTGSAWSSGLSESSTDSDKDDEIIDVIDCGYDTSSLKPRMTQRPRNLITINVPKAITLPTRLSYVKPSKSSGL